MNRLIYIVLIGTLLSITYAIYILPRSIEAKEPKYFLMTATGYYPGPECCYPFDDGFTAIGDVAGRGSVAIDDTNGPLHMGQRIWVEGYGFGKCNDRGSAIKEYRIDLCFDTLKEAEEWEVRLVRVYILD